MKNILIILITNFFFLSCIDMIKSSDEEFYESVHIQGGGWFEFYENSENENLELFDNFTLQVWFSGQLETDNEATCIVSLKGIESNISIYRNPNIDNMLMIYDNDELFQEIELDILDFNQNQNFYLLSIIKIQNQIIIYINDTVIRELATIENNTWNWIDLNNDGLYDVGEFEPFTDETNGVWDDGEPIFDYGQDGEPNTGDFGEDGILLAWDTNEKDNNLIKMLSPY